MHVRPPERAEIGATHHRLPILGVDIGGVIIARTSDTADTSFFSKNYLATPAVDGCFESLRRLAANRFAGRVYLVSKCGETVEGKTRKWLKRSGFHVTTGIPEEHLRFTRIREGKAPVCDTLGVTHFVDDRADVLEWMTNVPNRFLLLGGNTAGGEYAAAVGSFVRADSWPELEALLATPEVEVAPRVPGVQLGRDQPPGQGSLSTGVRPEPDELR